jgi:hypothetical protein
MRAPTFVVLAAGVLGLLLSGCSSTTSEVAGWSVIKNENVTTVARLRYLAHEVGRRVKSENPEWSAEAAEFYDAAASWSNALLVYSTPKLGDPKAKAQAVAIAREVEKSHTAFFAWAKEKRPDLVLLSWQPPEQMADGITEATAGLFDSWERMSSDQQAKCRKRLQRGYWKAFADL